MELKELLLCVTTVDPNLLFVKRESAARCASVIDLRQHGRIYWYRDRPQHGDANVISLKCYR